MSDAPEAVPPEVITGSRWKTFLFFLLSCGFVVVGAAMIGGAAGRDATGGWFVAIVFGLGAPVFGWLLIRPQVLTLDEGGFTLNGGLIRKPHRELWSDIDSFVLYRPTRGARMIGYIYRPGARPESALLKFNRAFGVEAGIPGTWPRSNARMVDLLNGRLQRSRGVPDAR